MDISIGQDCLNKNTAVYTVPPSPQKRGSEQYDVSALFQKTENKKSLQARA